MVSGAPGWNRTNDKRIRRPLLYPLSYGGAERFNDTADPAPAAPVHPPGLPGAGSLAGRGPRRSPPLDSDHDKKQ